MYAADQSILQAKQSLTNERTMREWWLLLHILPPLLAPPNPFATLLKTKVKKTMDANSTS